MVSKKKVAVVIGELIQPRFLTLFEALHPHFDVSVFLLNSQGLLNGNPTSLKLQVYEAIQDMPGYIRGIEDELVDFDAIIGLETSRLTTFQAVRAARKLHLPLGIVVNEFHPYFYEAYTNIRAVQFDVTSKADRFWPTSRLAAQNLELDHVDSSRICVIPPLVDTRRFCPDPKLRKKFRDYVGIGEREVVVLFMGELEAWVHPQETLNAIALLKQDPQLRDSRIRVIFAGNGSKAMDLKYRAADLGLGATVMFLHQDPTPFLSDLYNSADAIVMPKQRRGEFHEDIPLSGLEAMACGVVPIVTQGSIAWDQFGEGAAVATDDSFQALAATLKQAVMNPAKLDKNSQKARSYAEESHSRDQCFDLFLGEVSNLLSQYQRRSGRAVDFSGHIAEIRELLAKRELDDAMVKIEECFLMAPEFPSHLADLHCCKGDALYANRKIDEAMAEYSEGIKHYDQHAGCYRGLGFVAWHAHSNEDALTFFRKSLALCPDDPETTLGIGLVYRRLGLNEEALFWLEKSAASDRPPQNVYAALAQTCLECSIPENGIETLHRVIDSVGERKTLLLTLGQLYLKNGRDDIGNEMLARALNCEEPVPKVS